MNRLRRLRSLVTLRCASASELLSRRLDEPLDLFDRLALNGHLIACSPCRRFGRQIRFLREACLRRNASVAPVDPDALTPEARARILRSLRDEPSGDRGGA